MGTPTGGPSFAVGNMGTVNQATVQDLFRSYMNAITKPNISTYEMEIPRASWLRTWIGVIAVDIVSFVFGLIAAAIGSAAASAFLSQLSTQSNYDFSQYANFTRGYGAAFGGLIWTPIAFFIGAGILWLFARWFGGTGSDFMTHSYLLSLSYTPLRIIAAVLNVIPVLNFLAFIPFLYQLYCAGLAMQASQRMQSGRAQLAAFLPLIIGIVLFGLCICLAVLGLVAAFSTTNR
jgi:hypothetical protein